LQRKRRRRRGRPEKLAARHCIFRGGERALTAWDGTREASRAVHDALPFLVGAKNVFVYRINPPDDPDIAGVDIAAHLAQHGIEAEAHHTVSKVPEAETAVFDSRSLDTGDLLLSAASDFSVDMMRIRELVLGGNTRNILQHMTVPVLMSH
jgi:nucleotide-binding universal stress UspA family protein